MFHCPLFIKQSLSQFVETLLFRPSFSCQKGFPNHFFFISHYRLFAGIPTKEMIDSKAFATRGYWIMLWQQGVAVYLGEWKWKLWYFWTNKRLKLHSTVKRCPSRLSGENVLCLYIYCQYFFVFHRPALVEDHFFVCLFVCLFATDLPSL